MRTRQKERKVVNLPGRYFTGLGQPVDVTLSDLSTGGCRFNAGNNKLTLGSRIQIFVGPSGPHYATIKWVRKGEVGLTFAEPIPDDHFQSFKSSHVPDSQDIPGHQFGDMPSSLPQRFC